LYLYYQVQIEIPRAHVDIAVVIDSVNL